MMKTSKQSVSELEIPSYIREILSNNYCSSFLKMSILSENSRLHFYYDTENLRRIDLQGLKLYDKLLLISSVIKLCKLAEDYLISCESYLIEPELLYSKENRLTEDRLKILFYPDLIGISMGQKISNLINKLKENSSKQENEILDALAGIVNEEEWLKADRFICKNMTRLRT